MPRRPTRSRNPIAKVLRLSRPKVRQSAPSCPKSGHHGGVTGLVGGVRRAGLPPFATRRAPPERGAPAGRLPPHHCGRQDADGGSVFPVRLIQGVPHGLDHHLERRDALSHCLLGDKARLLGERSLRPSGTFSLSTSHRRNSFESSSGNHTSVVAIRKGSERVPTGTNDPIGTGKPGFASSSVDSWRVSVSPEAVALVPISQACRPQGRLADGWIAVERTMSPAAQSRPFWRYTV
jgi:hypothetical protein